MLILKDRKLVYYCGMSYQFRLRTHSLLQSTGNYNGSKTPQGEMYKNTHVTQFRGIPFKYYSGAL